MNDGRGHRRGVYIQNGADSGRRGCAAPPSGPTTIRIDPKPLHLDLKRDRGLTIQWDDHTTSYYSIAYLRKMSPSAETRELRAEMARNPLTVLPTSAVHHGPLTAIDAEFVGNYALRIRFSDGHDTGLYSWRYLREIDPTRQASRESSS